jgi:hypothetical protein
VSNVGGGVNSSPPPSTAVSVAGVVVWLLESTSAGARRAGDESVTFGTAAAEAGCSAAIGEAGPIRVG